MPVTPTPDQLPVVKLGSCKPNKLYTPLSSQIISVPKVGLVAGVTVIVVVEGLAQVPVGVKVKVTEPLCPTGLKFVPVTPTPDQLPVVKLGSCKASKLYIPLSSQIISVPKLGLVVGVTVIVVVDGLAQVPVGVKVKVTGPLCPAAVSYTHLTLPTKA